MREFEWGCRLWATKQWKVFKRVKPGKEERVPTAFSSNASPVLPTRGDVKLNTVYIKSKVRLFICFSQLPLLVFSIQFYRFSSLLSASLRHLIMVQPSNELFSSVTGSFSIGEGSQVQQLDTLSFLAGRELLPSGVSLHQQCNLLFRGKPDFFFWTSDMRS